MREVLRRLAWRSSYGPREATIICASHRLFPRCRSRPDRRRRLGAAAVGGALAGDGREGLPVPVLSAWRGTVGEGGGQPRVLGRRSLTAESFVPDLGAGSRGAIVPDGMWSNGRHGESSSGTARSAGKVRGFRIEPGEVESRLKEHPGVKKRCGGLAHGGDKRWWATWFRGRGERSSPLYGSSWPSSAFLHVPSAFVFLESAALTSTGVGSEVAAGAAMGNVSMETSGRHGRKA